MVLKSTPQFLTYGRLIGRRDTPRVYATHTGRWGSRQSLVSMKVSFSPFLSSLLLLRSFTSSKMYRFISVSGRKSKFTFSVDYLSRFKGRVRTVLVWPRQQDRDVQYPGSIIGDEVSDITSNLPFGGHFPNDTFRFTKCILFL